MGDEAEVPWNAVHSVWRNRRTKWRQVSSSALFPYTLERGA